MDGLPGESCTIKRQTLQELSTQGYPRKFRTQQWAVLGPPPLQGLNFPFKGPRGPIQGGRAPRCALPRAFLTVPAMTITQLIVFKGAECKCNQN